MEGGVGVPAVERDVAHGHKQAAVVCYFWGHRVSPAEDAAARIAQRRGLVWELGLVSRNAGCGFWVRR